MSERIQEIIEQLNGSCTSLGEACEQRGMDQEELTQTELAELDSQIFCCEVCGWWCESGEQSENELHQHREVCTDCEDDA
jgi:hypothetical protein